MAFPAVRSGIVTNGSSPSATPVLNLPATISAGDTILVMVRIAVAGTVAWPNADWHELFDNSADGADDQTACAWKKATGSEGGTTITVTVSPGGKFAAWAYAIQDAADPDVTPPEVSTAAIAAPASTTPDPSAVTPTGGAKDYLFIAACAFAGESTSPTYPTNYGSDQLFGTSGTTGSSSGNCGVAAAVRQLNASSEDPSNFVLTILDDWQAMTFAIHPAGGGGGGGQRFNHGLLLGVN